MVLQTMIEVQNLRKVYRLGTEKIVALSNINLQIPKGQICCILGTSGSGKSTLLNQLAGLEKPTRGRVILNGVDISKFSEKKLSKFRQQNVGFVFQSYNLLTSMTALENVAMPLVFRGMGKRKREKIARDMLLRVGLKGRMKHRPSQMSGGQQQRVGIARAFVCRPKIVFADEPTGNLDSKTTQDVMRLMVEMARKNQQTIVLVTHDRELALYADRIITILDGNVVGDQLNEHPKYVSGAGTPDEPAPEAVPEAPDGAPATSAPGEEPSPIPAQPPLAPEEGEQIVPPPAGPEPTAPVPAAP